MIQTFYDVNSFKFLHKLLLPTKELHAEQSNKYTHKFQSMMIIQYKQELELSHLIKGKISQHQYR